MSLKVWLAGFAAAVLLPQSTDGKRTRKLLDLFLWLLLTLLSLFYLWLVFWKSPLRR